eukprot:768564-Hanusia_phi.AAC.6
MARQKFSPGAFKFAIPLLAALLYGFVSVAATILTKQVVSGFRFKFLSFMMLLERCALMSGELLTRRSSRNVMDIVQRLWPLSLVSTINTFVAVSSLEGLNVPMYNALKRLTSLVTLGMEALVLKQYSSLQVQFAVAMIAGGAVIAALHDLEFAPLSYAWAMASCCLNALYLTLVKKFCNQLGSSSDDILVANSIVPIPILILHIAASGDRGIIGPPCQHL